MVSIDNEVLATTVYYLRTGECPDNHAVVHEKLNTKKTTPAADSQPHYETTTTLSGSLELTWQTVAGSSVPLVRDIHLLATKNSENMATTGDSSARMGMHSDRRTTGVITAF